MSYRWSDFTDDQDWLEELTNTLVANRASCWWDRWDVPQDDPQPIERLLGDILDDAVRQSAFLVALMRPRYLENGPCPVIPTWVRREWDQAGHENEQNRRHRMTRVAVLFGDQPAARQWLRPGDIPCRVAPDEPAHNVADLLTSLLPS